MTKRKKESDNYLAQIFNDTWEKILKHAKSNLLSDRLIGFNTLLFILVACFIVSRLWLMKDTVFSLGGLIVIVFSFLGSIVAGALYLLIIEALVDAATDKITPQRYSAIILLCGFSIAGAGLFLNVAVLSYVAIGIIACQIFLLLIGTFIGFSKEKLDDVKISANNFKGIFGDIGTIIGLISLIFQIIFFIVGIFITS